MSVDLDEMASTRGVWFLPDRERAMLDALIAEVRALRRVADAAEKTLRCVERKNNDEGLAHMRYMVRIDAETSALSRAYVELSDTIIDALRAREEER